MDLQDPAIKFKLVQLREKMLDWALEAALQRLEFARDIAQVLVRVDTGTLRDTIRIERGGEGMNWRRLSLRAGGYLINPKTGKLCDYAWIVELRYPFLGPAIKGIESDLETMIKNHVVDKANE